MKRQIEDDGIRQVDQEPDPVYANIFKIGMTRSDIGLDFGLGSKRGDKGVAYVMIPIAVAKVLGAMLTLAVGEYESKYGPVPDITKDLMSSGVKPFSMGDVQ